MSIPFGGINLDPVEIGTSGNAILGIRDSGKTYTATLLAEGLFDAGIPFIAFDPIGVWRYLRVPGHGRGYPIVVAGGQEGDLPLTVQSAPLIVEAAMKEGVSLVIDLFHMDLSKADWRRIVRESVKLLLHRNKDHGLRHIFLEEAAEFVPQKVNDWDVYAELEKLARMGGNSRLGYTLINQRSQEVNKAVLELCENLFLHRQKGKLSIENLKKWLDVAGASSSGIIASLPTLAQGECWAWLGGSDLPVHVQVPTKNSLHPDRRVMHGDAAIVKKAVSVSRFVGALQKALPQIEEAAKASDPKLLQAEVGQLKRKITALERGSAPTWPDQREAVSQLHAEGRADRATIAALEKRIRAAGTDLARLAKTLGAEITSIPDPASVSIGVRSESFRVDPAPAPARAAAARPAPASDPGEAGEVPSGCAKPLATLAGVYPGGMTEGQWATAAGYKKSGGTWKEYRSRLRRAEMIEQRDGLYYATALGAASAGDVELPPPPGPELARWWSKRISGTPKMVEQLIEAWPHRIGRDELGERLDMTPTGGSFKEYVSRLKRNGIIHENGDGVCLSPDVMGCG